MPTSKRNKVVPLSKITKKNYGDKKILLIKRINKLLKKI